MRGRATGIGSRVAAGVVIAAVAVLSGCTGTSQGSPVRESGQLAKVPDVSAAGRLDYACALAVDASTNHGPVDSWNIAVGDDADPVMHEVAGASGLLGALVGAHVAGHPELSEAATAYSSGLVQLDMKKMQQGLDDLAQGCRHENIPERRPDISTQGRVGYACALASDVAAHGGPTEEWLTVGDDAGPAAYEWGGAVGLLGAMTGSHVAGHQDLSEAASDILAAITRGDVKRVEQGLDALTTACGKR